MCLASDSRIFLAHQVSYFPGAILFKKDMQPFPELLQGNKYNDKFDPILQMMNDFTEKHLVVHLNSVDLCGSLWIIQYGGLVGGFKHFLFSISYIGCHPNPIDELHHYFKVGTLHHQPDIIVINHH